MVKQKIKTAVSLIKKGQFDLVWYKLLKLLGFKEVVPPLPHWLIVEPNNTCNFRCPLCPVGSKTLNRSPFFMPFDNYKRIIDQVRGYVTKILLFNYGESFFHKDIFKMIRYAVDSNIYVKISTNGSMFLDFNFCRKVINSGLQELIIELDGASQKTLEQYRVGSNFENITKGIRNIVKARKELKTKNPKIVVLFIIMKHNEDEISKVKRMVKDFGVDEFMKKTCFIYDGPNFQEKANRFLPVKYPFSRYYKDREGKFHLKGQILNKCNIVNASMAINSNGDVVPCCYDSYSKHIMGNVFKDSIKSIWRGKKYQEFRKQIKKDRSKIDICRTCPEHRVEKLVDRISLK